MAKKKEKEKILYSVCVNVVTTHFYRVRAHSASEAKKMFKNSKEGSSVEYVTKVRKLSNIITVEKI
jgi:hypothetical protein